MKDRSGTEEDMAKLPRVILGTPHWPAAERAGLVNVGGFWMTPENRDKLIEAHKAKRAEVQPEE
jgi:hypothetical protein